MIYIAAHKQFTSLEMDGYIPLQVGAENNIDLGYLKDNVGDNISEKNSNYCELTGLYWIWKNCNDEYKGLVHYRRYFGKSNLKIGPSNIYTYQEMVKMLEKADIVLPYLESFKQNAKKEILINCCTPEIFECLNNIIISKYPSYKETFDSFFNSNRASLFNMMFCKKEIFDDYCSWLFDILFELEKNISLDDLNDYQKRLYGFLSERLLNVWVIHQHLNVKHVNVTNIEMNLKDRITLLRRRMTNQILYSIQKE